MGVLGSFINPKKHYYRKHLCVSECPKMHLKGPHSTSGAYKKGENLKRAVRERRHT